MLGHKGDPIHGDQIHEVHKEHPHKNGQRHGGHEGIPGVLEGAADEIIDEVDDGLDEIEKAGGHAGGGLLCRPTKNKEEDQPEHQGPTHGVDVNGHKAHLGRFFRRLRETPIAHGHAVLLATGLSARVPLVELAVDQIRQVVLDITFRGEGAARCHMWLQLGRFFCRVPANLKPAPALPPPGGRGARQ